MNTLPQALDEYLALRRAMGSQVRAMRVPCCHDSSRFSNSKRLLTSGLRSRATGEPSCMSRSSTNTEKKPATERGKVPTSQQTSFVRHQLSTSIVDGFSVAPYGSSASDSLIDTSCATTGSSTSASSSPLPRFSADARSRRSVSMISRPVRRTHVRH
jgi:hypothetical protein